MEKEFDSARQFSKEIQKDERRQTAETIRAARKEYFSRKESLQKQLKELLADAEAKKLQAAEVRSNIETAESQIEQSSQKFLGRFLERKKIKQLQEQLGTTKITEESLAEELTSLEAAKVETEQSLQNRSELDKAKSKLDEFYQNSEQTWNDYEDDREAGNIKKIMRERGACIVHAFQNPIFSPSEENGLMRKELNWRDKLDLLTLEPTLSASAVNPDHTKTFAPVGVLLGEGQVKAAAVRDIGSKSADRTSRTGPRFSIKERVRDQINDALSEPETGWTEFVVSNPKITGLFFRFDSEDMADNIENIQRGSDATIPEIVQSAQERNLPLFVLKGGHFYSITPEQALALSTPQETVYTEKVGPNRYTRKKVEYQKPNLDHQQPVTAEQLADMQLSIDEIHREAALERLMTDSPFQLKRFPEALQVLARAEGRSYYHLFRGSKVEESGEKMVIPKFAAGNIQPLEVTLLKSIPGPTHIENCVRFDDGSESIWRQSRKPVSEYSRTLAGSTYYQDALIDRDRTVFVGGIQLTTERVENVTDIINAVAKKQQELTSYTRQAEARGETYYAENWKNWNMRLSFFLYGIAEEARCEGDQETAIAAEDIVSQVLPKEEFQATITKRVSESGTFKITKEELLGKAA